jgi:ankyrin repeat protein
LTRTGRWIRSDTAIVGRRECAWDHVKLLLEKNVDADYKSSNSRTPLLWAAESGCDAMLCRCGLQ